MPRIYTSQSEPLDFCLDCFPLEAAAALIYGNLGDGPDGRGNCFAYDAAHPNYEDDPGFYVCEICGEVLTSRDE